MKGGGNDNDGGSGVTWVASQNEFVATGNYQNNATFGTYSLTCPAGATYASYILRLPGFYTGIENFQSNFDDLIYPNPATGFVHINITNVEDAESLMLLNPLGQVVFEMSISDNQNDLTIDVSKFPSGIYTAKINSADSFTTCKVQVIK